MLRPGASTSIEQGTPVYFLSGVPGAPIERGVIRGQNGLEVSVGSRSMQQFVHRTGVFTPGEVGGVALDLLPAPGRGEERHLISVLDQLVRQPGTGEELYVRLASLALERYVSLPRSPHDLGVRSEAELIGDAGLTASNTWKIEELIGGIRKGEYHAGDSNTLRLAHARKDVDVLPGPKAEAVRARIAQTNRDVLDHLYDTYGVNFGDATVVEKIERDWLKRTTVYPSSTADFCFVETYVDFNEPRQPEPSSASLNVTIVVGTPEYIIDQGYWPV